jgi:hypothetical protein
VEEEKILDIEEAPTSRRKFLRKLGVLTAIGLGAAVFPGRALAELSWCCPNAQTCGYDSQGRVRFWCSGGGCGNCCIGNFGTQCGYAPQCPCA